MAQERCPIGGHLSTQAKAALWACEELERLTQAEAARAGEVHVEVPEIGQPVFVAMGVGLHAGEVVGWSINQTRNAGPTLVLWIMWTDEDGEGVQSMMPPEAVFKSAEAAAVAMWGRA